MRHCVALCCLLAVVLAVTPVHAAEDAETWQLERLVSLGEIPLERIANFGGLIAAKSVSLDDGSDYLKTVLPPVMVPTVVARLQKRTLHLVVLVNLRPEDILHPHYWFFAINPKDVVVDQNDALVVPTVRAEFRNPKNHTDGIQVHLAMSRQERERSPSQLPVFTP